MISDLKSFFIEDVLIFFLLNNEPKIKIFIENNKEIIKKKKNKSNSIKRNI